MHPSIVQADSAEYCSFYAFCSLLYHSSLVNALQCKGSACWDDAGVGRAGYAEDLENNVNNRRDS